MSNEPEHRDKARRMKADVEAIRSWYSRAYNRAFARQLDVEIFETTHVFDSLWWARACGRDHDPTAVPTDKRGARLGPLLVNGTLGFRPRDVPDSRAPKIEVPCQMTVLVDARYRLDGTDEKEFEAWDRAFSLVEYRRPPTPELQPAFMLAFDGLVDIPRETAESRRTAPPCRACGGPPGPSTRSPAD